MYVVTNNDKILTDLKEILSTLNKEFSKSFNIFRDVETFDDLYNTFKEYYIPNFEIYKFDNLENGTKITKELLEKLKTCKTL